MNYGIKGTVTNPEAIYGKSAYEIAVKYGFEGTEEEWIKAVEANVEINRAYTDTAVNVKYVETQTVYVGDNVLGAATLGEGWTANDDSYTHETGFDADLTFETTIEDGAIYILEFDTSYTAGEFVRVGIGNMYRVLCYQGKSHIIVPLMASGGTTLYISPVEASYTGSISNIMLRKIQKSGTACTLDLYSTITNNHTQNYGFWNTLIGDNIAENAVGTTRSVGIGYCVLQQLQGGHRNIGIGTYVMSQLIGGEENVSIGADSMLAVKLAEGCVSIGMSAMYSGASRKSDIALGKDALRGVSESTTEDNVAIGSQAGHKVTTAKQNVFIGRASGYNNTSGYGNTYIGDGAGKTGTTGYFNTVIGRNADIPATVSNTVVIGNGAKATKSNRVVIGNDSIEETHLKGKLIVQGNSIKVGETEISEEQLATLVPPMGLFTFLGHTFNFDVGMTWSKFIDSHYNQYGDYKPYFEDDHGDIFNNQNEEYVTYEKYDYVLPEDEIIDGYTYKCAS